MVKVWFIIQLKRCQLEMVGFRVPSLKLTAKAAENGWLEYDPASFWGKKPIFQGANLLLVSGSVPGTYGCFQK